LDGKSLNDLKAEQLANPAVRQAYDAQAPEFELARDLIAGLREMSTLVDQDPSPDTLEGESLDALSIMIEAYERKHYPGV
jgi:HTH-type transcriptional regulator/antitoxin HigA